MLHLRVKILRKADEEEDEDIPLTKTTFTDQKPPKQVPDDGHGLNHETAIYPTNSPE